MSLSKPKITNPCKKFIEFKGNTGAFQYWDKATESNIQLKSPVKFIVLDELSTITGFSDEFQCGIYSNEVHSLRDEVLSVRLFKKNHRLVGKYSDIKGDITSMGGKFCKSVYSALIGDKGELELVNFRLRGAALSAWMDCVIDKSAFAIIVEDCTDGKKGSVKYKIPNFKQFDLPLGMIEKAVVMDKSLQDFLREYFNSQIIKSDLKKEEAEAKEDSTSEESVPF